MLTWAALKDVLCGHTVAAITMLREALEISEHQAFPLFRGFARVITACALPEDAELIAQGERAFADVSGTGAVSAAPFLLAFFAAAKAESGAPRDALGLLQLARGVSEQFKMPF